MSEHSDTEKYLMTIREAYRMTTTTTSKLCRTIVFALIASIWVLFQQNGTFTFPEWPTRAIGLLGIYIFLDVFQYFSSASSYFALYLFRRRLGDHIGEWQHRTDQILYCVFLVKILYLIVVIGVCVYYAFQLNITDVYQHPISQ